MESLASQTKTDPAISPKPRLQLWISLLPWVFLSGILLNFLIATRSSLNSWFSQDDFLNYSVAWSHSLGDAVRAFFLLKPSYYRPLGELYYLVLNYATGLNPLPWNLSRLMLCAGCIFVCYWFALSISRDKATAVFTAGIAAFDQFMASLYFDTGMIYDVLAFLFYFSAVAIYIDSRRQKRSPKLSASALIVFLYLCAIDSKEIGVTVPIALILYEVVFQSRDLLKFDLRKWIAPATMTAMAVIETLGKTMAPGALTEQGGYAMTVSWAMFRQTWSSYAAQFLHIPVGTIDPYCSALLIGCIVLALLMRNRVLIWASLMNIVIYLPIAFIRPRAGFAFFLPLAIVALYLAEFCLSLLRFLDKFYCAGFPILQYAFIASFLIHKYSKDIEYIGPRVAIIQGNENRDREAYLQFRQLLPDQLSGKRILLLHSPFTAFWIPEFIAQYEWNDKTIEVFAPERIREYHLSADPRAYDYVIDYAPGHYWLVRH